MAAKPEYEIEEILNAIPGTGSVYDSNSIIENLDEEENGTADPDVTASTPNLEESLRSIPEEQRNISILILGNPGSGKSTLINSLLRATGTNTPKIQHGIESQHHDDIEIFAGIPNCYSETYKSKLTICDTNGLPPQHQQVGFFEKSMGTKISKRLKDEDIVPDLIFICIPLRERFSEFPDVYKIAARLKYENFWHRTVIMLTFANVLSQSIDKNTSIQEVIQKAVSIIQKCLQEQEKIKGRTVSKIPFVCIGKAVTVTEDDTDKNANDWTSGLLEACYNRCSKETRLVFLNIAQVYWQKRKYLRQQQSIEEAIRSPTIYSCFAGNT